METAGDKSPEKGPSPWLRPIRRIFQYILTWLDRRTFGAVSIFQDAVRRFNRVRGAEAAASIGYYALFSLFPLLLFLTSVVGYLLLNVQSPEGLVNIITDAIPVSRSFIQDNLLAILEQRQTTGAIGLLGIGWAASGVFTTLLRNINRAWPEASIRNIIQGRLIALGMIFILTILFIAILLVITFFNILPRLGIPVLGSSDISNTLLWRVVSRVIPWFFAFLIFLALYHWGPNTRVTWREAFWGALFSTIVWEIATAVFTWFVRSGIARYEILYGSLGTSLALLTWIYLTAWITLFGAHLSSAVAHRSRLAHHQEPPV